MPRVQKTFSKPSMTKQSFQKQCDINHIVKRFRQVHNVDILSTFTTPQGGLYGDFTDVPDLLTAQQHILRANEAFAALPSAVRSRFQNDSLQFLQFVSNPDNSDEMVSLGLASKPVQAAPKTDEPAPVS